MIIHSDLYLNFAEASNCSLSSPPFPLFCPPSTSQSSHIIYLHLSLQLQRSRDTGRNQGYEAGSYSFLESSKTEDFKGCDHKSKSHSLGFIPCLLFVYFILCMGRGHPWWSLLVIITINQSEPVSGPASHRDNFQNYWIPLFIISRLVKRSKILNKRVELIK